MLCKKKVLAVNAPRDTEFDNPAQKISALKGYRSRRPTVTFSDPSEMEDRLWNEWATRRAVADLSNLRIALIGFTGKDLSRMRDLMSAVGVASCSSNSNVSALGDLDVGNGAHTHVIVNLEAFDTILDAVIKLLDFREAERYIKLLLVSRNVQADDLGSERNTLCDATLKMPFSLTRLREILIESCA